MKRLTDKLRYCIWLWCLAYDSSTKRPDGVGCDNYFFDLIQKNSSIKNYQKGQNKVKYYKHETNK